MARLDFVPFYSSLGGMTWANDEELLLILRSGLREGYDLIRGTRRSLTEDQERIIADAIVRHLEQGNWRVERGTPATGASGLMGSRLDER
jgi:hypothetical protein